LLVKAALGGKKLPDTPPANSQADRAMKRGLNLLPKCFHADAEKLRQCLASLAFQIELPAGQHLHILEAGSLYFLQIFLLLQSSADAARPGIRVTLYLIGQQLS